MWLLLRKESGFVLCSAQVASRCAPGVVGRIRLWKWTGGVKQGLTLQCAERCPLVQNEDGKLHVYASAPGDRGGAADRGLSACQGCESRSFRCFSFFPETVKS